MQDALLCEVKRNEHEKSLLARRWSGEKWKTLLKSASRARRKDRMGKAGDRASGRKTEDTTRNTTKFIHV